MRCLEAGRLLYPRWGGLSVTRQWNSANDGCVSLEDYSLVVTQFWNGITQLVKQILGLQFRFRMDHFNQGG